MTTRPPLRLERATTPAERPSTPRAPKATAVIARSEALPPHARPLPDRAFFRVGEVAQLVGVAPHVIRYWEQELGLLKPMKTRGAHRQYRRRDVELARQVRKLIYDEGLTLAGARKRLLEGSSSHELETARGELQRLLQVVTAKPPSRATPIAILITDED